MGKKLTDEERAFIVDHPDYPAWVILESFEKRFGRKVTKQTLLRLRGTINKHWGRGKGKTDRVSSSIEWHSSNRTDSGNIDNMIDCDIRSYRRKNRK